MLKNTVRLMGKKLIALNGRLPDEELAAQMEKEADLFARCLLMPEDMIRNHLLKMAKGKRSMIFDLCDDNNYVICKLSEKFEVSKSMMLLRLYELGVIK